MFGRFHLWSHLVLDFCLLEFFKSQFQFQCFWFVCSYFVFLPGSVLKGNFLRICPFLLGCPFYWHKVAFSSLLMMLCISVVSVVTSFSLLILLIWAISLFSLMSLAKGLSILFIFSKNQLFSFIDVFDCFLHFYFIYFCPDLYDFFPSVNSVFLFYFL